MFKLLSISCETYVYPANHTQWHCFCQTLYTVHTSRENSIAESVKN